MKPDWKLESNKFELFMWGDPKTERGIQGKDGKFYGVVRWDAKKKEYEANFAPAGSSSYTGYGSTVSCAMYNSIRKTEVQIHKKLKKAASEFCKSLRSAND